jgi:CP family cyanate transporter-like MFS transporter
MFTVSYTCAVIVPVLSGLSWDASGVPALAFIPIGLCNFVLIGLASTIPAPASRQFAACGAGVPAGDPR